MASKRKSTVPCMIPSKSKHVREEILLGSLPELLPTIPEDSILSISGEDSGHFSHGSSRSEGGGGGGEIHRGGTYGCPACRFESRDLNYFLDHMHNCHLDFRAQPTFYCLNCGVSVVRFEALALHNATAHPKIMEGVVTASLSVNKRDGATAVEQSLFAEGGEDLRESGISVTKTPIAKIMKAKGEHKKIVVSHTVEVRKIDTGKDVDPSMLTNVPELQNGALSVTGAPAMPRNTVNHVMTTTVSDQVFHQHTPSLYSSPSPGSNKDLPKVMIPLSSIPTYDAAMDTSSFLKTSFGKFPYPTKAELCYLTVVSEFPEEQIKLWFTAQRLKQGISWSPEEIEEARRKMFNTVFQGGAPQKQPQPQRQVNHIVTHHTVHAGSRGPTFPMAKGPFGGLKRPMGVTTTQASVSTKPHITRVSYSTPIAPPKFPPVARTAQVLAKNTQGPAETDKSNGVGLDMAASGAFISSTSSCRSSSSSSSSCSSSSSISSYSSNSNGVDAVARRPVHNSIANVSNKDEQCAASANGKPNPKSAGSPVGPVGGSNGTESHAAAAAAAAIINNSTSKSSSTCNNHNRGMAGPQEQAHSDQRNNFIHKTGNGSISGDYPGTTGNDSVPNHASKTPTQSTSTTVITQSTASILDEGKCGKDFPIKGMSILKQLIKDEDPFAGDRDLQGLKADPVKINFKRLKMSEPETTSDSVHQEHRSEASEASASQPAFSPPWGGKTPQQLQVLQQVFSTTRWPSSQHYEDLSVQTGLPKSEVVRWFSDSRYSRKNGQLKWLGTFHRPPAEPEGHAQAKEPLAAKKKLGEKDANKHLEGDAGQQVVWQDSYSPLLGLMGSAGAGGGRGAAKMSAQPPVLQGAWTERVDDHQQPVATQTLIDQQTDASQARDRLRMELLEV